MRWSIGAWAVLVLACGPAVPADTNGGDATEAVEEASDGLPPLTSGSTAPIPVTSSAATAEAGEESDTKLDFGGLPTSGLPEDGPCWEGWDVTPLPPAVVLVVDVSGSMVDVLVDHDADPTTPSTTRWFALWTALSDDLLDWDLTHDLGLRTYPSALATDPPDPFACDPDGVTLVPDTMGAALVLDALPLPGDTTLAGAAPLRSAFNEALALLSVVDPGKQQRIVIITDGAPNCAPDDVPPASFDQVDAQVEDSIYLAARTGIHTAVVAFDVPDAPQPGGDGEPAVNPRVVLDALALAGGIGPAALVAADTPSLLDRLSELRVALASDRLRLPDTSYSDYYVEIDGVPIPYTFSCDEGDGFTYVETDDWDTLQLCGEAALALQRAGHAHIWPQCAILE
ncbi:MAG: hypothetical protein KDK70_18755 [Myxococcales bacterium]|nr:hypothetical protein [Myxococcales bacterium]